MGKKKASGELGVGSRIRVRPGTTIPEFPDTSCAGWTGEVVESTGKKPAIKFIVQWDDDTLGKMPKTYVGACEAQGLYYRMACLEGDSLEAHE